MHSKLLSPLIFTSLRFNRNNCSQTRSASRMSTSRSQASMSESTSLNEERRMNKLSEKMGQFHEYFKQEFNMLYELADGSFERRGYSLSIYLGTAKSLIHHLTMHHTIEERYLFPILGKRMPQFTNQHLVSHKGIHDGLDDLGKEISKWSEQPSTYSPQAMKRCLDSFREVLFNHLDEEVADLRGENLKKYFTLEEVESFPI